MSFTISNSIASVVAKGTLFGITCFMLCACGGGGSGHYQPYTDSVSLREGEQLSLTFGGGNYTAEITSSNHGVTVKWVGGANCASSGETTVYRGTCQLGSAGQLVITNPTTFGTGGNELVSIKVSQN